MIRHRYAVNQTPLPAVSAGAKPIQLQADIAVDPTLAKACCVHARSAQPSARLADNGFGSGRRRAGRSGTGVVRRSSRALPFLEPGNGREVLDYFIGREAFLLRDHDRALVALDRALDADPAYQMRLLTKGSVFTIVRRSFPAR